LHELYESNSQRGHRFRYGLLIFDLLTVALIVAASFVPDYTLIEVIDVVFGLVFLADFVARLAISRKPGATCRIHRAGPTSLPFALF
jgi:voltage-gated potassium channel